MQITDIKFRSMPAHGKLRALVHEPGAGYSGYTAEEAKAEQQRLDEAGCGVGSAS